MIRSEKKEGRERGMKRLGIVVAGAFVWFAMPAVVATAGSSSTAPSANAIGTFTGTETASTPVSCGSGKWVITTATFRGNATDTSAFFGAPETTTPPNLSGKITITALTTVNIANGWGYGKGLFNHQYTTRKRLHGSFFTVNETWNQLHGTSEGRGYVTAVTQVKNTKGRWVNKPGQGGLQANVEYRTSDGSITGSFGSDWTAPGGAGTFGTPATPATEPNLSVKTKACT
jgi:hypothetical protein